MSMFLLGMLFGSSQCSNQPAFIDPEAVARKFRARIEKNINESNALANKMIKGVKAK